jgi:cell division protein ZapA (FtsZ GTPase activity inhibitor)
LTDTVTVNILGHEYKVKSGGDPEHVRSLSIYINERLKEVQKHRNAVSTMELVTLVMLNMADEISGLKSQQDEHRQIVAAKIEEMIERIDDLVE